MTIEPAIESRRMRALSDEMTLLGLCLSDASLLAESERLLPTVDLDSPTNRALMAYLRNRMLAGEATDLAAVLHGLIEDRQIDRCGGVTYVSELPDNVPMHLDLVALCERIRGRAHLRQLIDVGQKLIEAGKGLSFDDPIDVASSAAMDLNTLSRPIERTEHTLAESLERARQRRAEAKASGRALAVPTGSQEVDDLLDGGLRCGELVIVAGRPGTGKTAFALGLTAHAAANRWRVGVVSLEMGDDELADRLLSLASSMGLAHIRRGAYDDDDGGWRDALGQWEVMIDSPPEVTVTGLAAIARRWSVTPGLDLLIVDYLGLVRMPRAERHDLAVGAVTAACKALARQLQIPVVLLVQLNREVEKRGLGKRIAKQSVEWWRDFPLPHLADLRDSGSIEQDADVVLFPLRGGPLGLDLPAPPGQQSPGPDEHSACLVVAKNRNGRTGIAGLEWRPHTASYRLGAP